MGISLTLDDTHDGKNASNGLALASTNTSAPISLSTVSRVKSLALEGVIPEDIIRVVAVRLADVMKILSEPLSTAQVEATGITRLIDEHAAYLEYVKGKEELDKEDGKAVTAFYDKYIKPTGITVIPTEITYASIAEYKRTTKTTIVENTSTLVEGLRKTLITNLYKEAVNGMIPRREAVGILRVIGLHEKDNKGKELSNITHNDNRQTAFVVQFNKDKIAGQEALTINKEGEVLGVGGEISNNISRQDLMEMLSNLETENEAVG